MTQLVFFLRAEFGAGAVAFRYPEQRIVAKAVLAAGGVQDAAFPGAFADQRDRVFGVAQQSEGADELGAALGIGHVFQRVEQLGVVGRVTSAAGVAGGVDTGCAAKGVDRQAGVVGQGGQARYAGGMAGLDQRVFDEGEAGFFGFDIGEVALRAYLDAVTQHGL